MEELKSQIKGFDVNVAPPADIINIARALKQHESSGGKFNVGDHGTSRGNYMFQEGTWKDYSTKVFGKVVPMTPTTENMVVSGIMYDRVYNKGYDIKRAIASWNAPAPAASNTWQNWKGVSVRNGKKIEYDTPGYVDKVMKYYDGFSKQPLPVSPVVPVEPKYGSLQETESQQLSRLQSQKANKDAISIQEQQGREGIVDNVVGGAKDFVQGLGNSATRMGGNIVTFGNEAIQKAGFKGSENPVLNYGTEANKFATGDATAGTNIMQKAGGFAGDVAQVVAPVPGAGKVTGALKGTELLRKLAGMGGAGANIASKAVGFGARALPVALEGSAAGAQADILTTGDVGLGSTLGYGLTNVGANHLFSMLGKKTGIVKDIRKQIDEVLEKIATNKDEKMVKPLQEELSRLQNSPEMNSYLFAKGLTTPEAIAAKQAEEIDGVRKALSSVGDGEIGYVLSQLPEDDIKAFLQLNEVDIKPFGNKLNYSKSFGNAEKYKKITGSKIDEIKQAIIADKSNPLNNIDLNEIRALAKQKALQKNIYKIPSDKTYAEDFIDKQIDTQIKEYKGKNSFEAVDKLRLAGNRTSKTMTEEAALEDMVLRSMADAVREKTDQVLDVIKTTMDPDMAKLVDEFKLLNKTYGNLTGAQDIMKQMQKIPIPAQNRLAVLGGGILATGGSYDPLAFYGGTYVSNKIADAFRKSSALNMTPGTANSIPGTKFKEMIMSNTGEMINKSNTKKVKAPKTQPALKDPRSLRDILLNQPK